MHKSRWGFTHAEWARLGGFGGAIALLHILGWGLFAVYAPPNGGTPTAKTTTTVSRSASSTTTQQKEKQPAAARENGSRQKCGPPCGVKQSVGRVICQFKGDEQTKCCDNGPKITDWLMAAFAGLLVYVGARIGGRQLDLMSEQNAISREQNAITRRQAEIQEGALRATAEAAQAANTNAITAVRPWLMARPDGPLEGWTFEWQETEGIRLLKVKWSIKNQDEVPPSLSESLDGPPIPSPRPMGTPASSLSWSWALATRTPRRPFVRSRGRTTRPSLDVMR